MKGILAIVGAAVLLSGCANLSPKNTPNVVIGNPTDYGDYPTNYVQLVNATIKASFKDPDSVKDLEINKPVQFKFTKTDPFYLKQTDVYGYLISYSCNAKNSFGGYTGIKVHFLNIRLDHGATNPMDRMILGDNFEE